MDQIIIDVISHINGHIVDQGRHTIIPSPRVVVVILYVVVVILYAVMGILSDSFALLLLHVYAHAVHCRKDIKPHRSPPSKDFCKRGPGQTCLQLSC